MPDDEDPTRPDGTVWCEACQEHVPADYAHAHDQPLTDEARQRLHDLLQQQERSDG